MSLVSLEVSSHNPVTSQTIAKQLLQDGLKLAPQALEEYALVCAAAHESFIKILSLPDYVPEVDIERFPRRDVHMPAASENPHNAWAWRVSVCSSSPHGLLKGRTICLKDNICLKDVPCLLGTEAFSDWIPNMDATVCTRILEAGGEITGKAVCEDLCLWAASCSAGTGPMDNVFAPGYSAGGSSSGTAVLVARDLCDMGVAADQGGSIRLPSAHNGIVGLKPTSGLVPYTGVASVEQAIDHVGPMTKSVMDNALLLKVIAGADGIDDRQRVGCPTPHDVPDYPAIAKEGILGMKVGIIQESLMVPTADPRVSTLVIRAAHILRTLGAEVDEISVPDHLLGSELWAVVSRMGATQTLRGEASGRRGHYMNDLTAKLAPLDQVKFEKLFPSMVNAVVSGTYAKKSLSPTLVGKTMNLVRKLKDDYDRALSTFDVLITPTMPFLPKKLLPRASTPLTHFVQSAGMTANTNPFNLTGHPALSVPVGFLPTLDDPLVKLPVGMQIIGKWWEEGTVYRVAQAFEETQDWRTFHN